MTEGSKVDQRAVGKTWSQSWWGFPLTLLLCFSGMAILGKLMAFVIMGGEPEPLLFGADLSMCSVTKQSFSAVAADKVQRWRSNTRGVYAQFRLFFHENKEAAEKNFRAASLMDPCNSWAHLQLAKLRLKRGDYEGAEASYAAGLKIDPHDFLARRKYDEIRQARTQGEFWGNMVTLLRDHPDLSVTETGQLDMASRNRTVIADRLEVATRVLSEKDPIRLVMKIEHLSDKQLQEQLSSDAQALEQALVGAGKIASKLPPALQQVRALENNTKWLITYAVERLKFFENPQVAMLIGTYGITWLSGFKTVFARPGVAAALRGRANGAVVMVIGSGLGYQCLYALALGAKKCIGYEVLCNTMNFHASDIASTHGLSDQIEHRCLDARKMKKKDVKSASVVWINDSFFNAELQNMLLEKVAADLKPDSMVVAFSNAPGTTNFGLSLEDAVQVEVSWKDRTPVYIYRKVGAGENALPSGKQSQGPSRFSTAEL